MNTKTPSKLQEDVLHIMEQVAAIGKQSRAQGYQGITYLTASVNAALTLANEGLRTLDAQLQANEAADRALVTAGAAFDAIMGEATR